MGPLLTDRFTSLLNSYLDVQSRRAQVIAGNIANADTPGFIAKELDFSSYLRRVAHTATRPPATDPARASAPALFDEQPRIIEQSSNVVSLDGNTVDVQREMAALSETGVNFMTGVQLLQSRLRTLRTAIREGR